MANYLVTDAQLQAIANKIRQKTGGSAAIQFYSAFVSEIEKLTDTRDANASASDILNGKTAYVNKNKVTGNISSKAAATYNTSGSDQSIAAGQYLSGAQTIKAVTTSNIDAGNIKTGVTVKVGDANSAGRIKNVTGTYTSDATAGAGHILSGKTAYVNGSKVTGNIASKAAATYNTSSSDQNVASGQYLSGAQTIKAVTTSNIDAGNIKVGVNVKVGDANSSGRIKDVTGTFTSDANAVASDIVSGKTAYVNGSKITGNIPLKGAATYNVSSGDQTISSGYCLSGNQTIRGVSTQNIDAGNIKCGVNVKVGDAGSAGRIKDVTGTYVTPVKVVSSQYVNQSNITVGASGTLCDFFDVQRSNATVTADKCKPILDCLPTISGGLVRGDISSGGVMPQVTLSDITGGIRVSLYLSTSSGSVIIGANSVSLNYGIAMPDI